MNFHRRPKKDRGARTLLAVVALLVVVVIFFQFAGPNLLTSPLHAVARPLWSVGAGVGGFFENSIGFFRSRQALISENRALKEELVRLRDASFITQVLREENRQLKEKLGRRTLDNRVLAAVLVRPNKSLYDTFIIDIGHADNIGIGDPVIAGEDHVLGFIESVQRKTAIVKLFSTPGERVDVIIGPENIAAVAEGRGSGNFIVVLPRGIPVEEGSAIIMPNITPRLFGVVGVVIVRPADSFQTILFKSPVNIAELRFVEVIRQ